MSFTCNECRIKQGLEHGQVMSKKKSKVYHAAEMGI